MTKPKKATQQAKKKRPATATATVTPSRPPTEFEKRVYALCAAIPRGRVSTYGAMAAALSCGSAQAIGQAMRRNPWAPWPVPCHRVVASSRSIGGFHGEGFSPCCPGGHVSRKRAMLLEEGVRFENEDEETDKEGYWRIARASVLSAKETAALAPGVPLQKLAALAKAAGKKWVET
jgi:methylated-DNA-[protein]-cysteine S-methyltransferase